MSAGVARGNATTRLGRIWQDWRFHLGALIVVVPVAFFPSFFNLAMMGSGKAGLGAREPSVVEVGPFPLRIAEFNTDAPIAQGVAGDRKVFGVALCTGCEDRIRAVYLRVGKPRSVRAAGAMFSGAPARLMGDVQIPGSAKLDDGLWLTVEEWDGSVHMGGISFETASPATAKWLARKEGGQK
ncbi:hypothetical protein [Paracoccus aminophilus]|uniref:Uncharacterized protein n=1 Tax=Paracoccus aminophilus JCM 7686 TaxID=1367847 RepID=S5YTS2_PARAH|nr:hypothetical protein [Paracoccus aminophilus]AGT08611.1 hypothetical protein JCM7686_1510 [Paracoccus aminophilus JCM 7686]